MTDRELLEAAARAAGMWPESFELDDECRPVYHEDHGLKLAWGAGWWSSLQDDGDAFRLEVALGLVVDCSRPSAAQPFHVHSFAQDDPSDILVATRRAITRAAAAMAPEAS